MISRQPFSYLVPLALFAVFWWVDANADAPKLPRRLSSQITDLGEVSRIYMRPAMVSVIQFPVQIQEVRVGNPQDVKAVISATFGNEVVLSLTRGASLPTNLIARSQNRAFVIDVIPSLQYHQDYIRVTASYGAPAMDDDTLELVDSTERRHLERIRLNPSAGIKSGGAK